MRLTAARLTDNADVLVVIHRPEDEEKLSLLPQDGEQGVLMSTNAPGEPHEFDARLVLRVGDHEEILPFRMVEPEGHHH